MESRSPWILVPFMALVLGLAVPADAAERMLELRFDAGRRVQIDNLAGTVHLVPGEELLIRATVSAENPAAAEQVQLATRERNGAVEVSVVYPADVSRVRYEDGELRRLDVNVDYLGRRMRVTTGSGERVRVDLEITVPAEQELTVRQRVGSITAERVRGDLTLASRYGRVRVTDSAGRLRADTGSGAIGIAGFRGDVTADTGSGAVSVENVLGQVLADTGSGGVVLRGIDGDVVADTGSGSVRLHDVKGSLRVDTGSGSVRGERLVVGKNVTIDTGSGGVSLEGDLGAVRNLVARTGSGGVTLRSETPMSLQLQLSTGSGGIRVDAPALSDVTAGRRSFRGVMGPGEGSARISTGSGAIRISAP